MDLKLYGNDYINSTLKNFVQEENINDLCKVTNNYANVAVYNHFYDENDPDNKKNVFTNLKIGDFLTIKVPTTENNETVYKESKVRVCEILKSDLMSKGDGSLGRNFEVITSNNHAKDITGEKKYTKLGINLVNPNDKTVNKKVEEVSNSIQLSQFESKLSFNEMQEDSSIDNKKDAPLFLYMNRARCYYFLAIKEHGSEQSTKFNEFIVKSEQDFDEALKINTEDKRFGNIRNIKDEIVRMKNNIDLLKKYNSEDLKKDYYIYFDKFVHLDEICKLIDKDSNNENLYLFRVDICYEIIKNCKFIIIISVEAKFMLNDILKSYNLNPKNIKIYNIIEKIYFRFLNDTDHFLKETNGYLIKNDYDFIVDHRQKFIKDIIEYISIENELSDLENIYYVLGKIYFKLSKFDIKNSKKYLNKSLKYIDKNVKDSIKNKLYIGLHYKYEVLIDICKEIKSLEKDKRSLDDLTKKISIYNKKLKKINTQNSN